MATVLRTVAQTRAIYLSCRSFQRLISLTKHVDKVRFPKSFSSSSSVASNIDVTRLTSRDEENILTALNTMSKEELSETGILPPSLLTDLCTHRSENGPFVSLGEVLGFPGMVNKVFKKICSTFQYPKRSKKKSSSDKDQDYAKYFSPLLSPETMEDVKSVTSIEVCLDSVCFASVTRDQKVTDWSHIPLKGSSNHKQSPALVLEQALQIVPQIPKADIYLIETRISRKLSLEYMPIHMFVARLQTAIQTLLTSHHLEQSGNHLLHFVNHLFVARMFDLRVGGERVSGQHIVQEIEDGKAVTQVEMERNLWRQFHRLRTGVEKERYTICLLAALAFVNYISPVQTQAAE